MAGLRRAIASASLLLAGVLSAYTGSNAAIAEQSVEGEKQSWIWLQCLGHPTKDSNARYFGYFVFDKIRNTLRKYDEGDEGALTVTDLHAQVAEDTITWSTAFSLEKDNQKVDFESKLTINRRSLAILEKEVVRVTTLPRGTVDAVTHYYQGQCKKAPSRPILDRQL